MGNMAAAQAPAPSVDVKTLPAIDKDGYHRVRTAHPWIQLVTSQLSLAFLRICTVIFSQP